MPAVLQGGHNAEIEKWRRQQSLVSTAAKRPDLLAVARAAGALSKSDEMLLQTVDSQAGQGK